MADSATHLVVVAHGLHGSPESCGSIRDAILEAHPSGAVAVILSSCSATTLTKLNATTDGVAAGGERLANEIRSALQERPAITRLSLIGVSLGGLYTRSALSHLLDLPHDFVNFITFATPHVGVRGHLGGVFETAVRWGAVGLSGTHLLLADTPLVRDGCGPEPLPLLAWMAHPASPHVRALRRFAHRVLIANVEGDDKVPHWSAALVQGGAAALDASAELAVRQDGSLPGDALLYPHVTATFKQRPVSAPLEAPAVPGGVTESLKLPPEDPGSLEAQLISQLRSGVGGWANVEVLFREPGASFLNHIRIADSRPWLTSVGADVPRFVAQKMFAPVV